LALKIIARRKRVRTSESMHSLACARALCGRRVITYFRSFLTAPIVTLTELRVVCITRYLHVMQVVDASRDPRESTRCTYC